MWERKGRTMSPSGSRRSRRRRSAASWAVPSTSVAPGEATGAAQSVQPGCQRLSIKGNVYNSKDELIVGVLGMLDQLGGSEEEARRARWLLADLAERHPRFAASGGLPAPLEAVGVRQAGPGEDARGRLLIQRHRRPRPGSAALRVAARRPLTLAGLDEVAVRWQECVQAAWPEGPFVLPPVTEPAAPPADAYPDVPAYDSDCQGGPKEWNERDAEAAPGGRYRGKTVASDAPGLRGPARPSPGHWGKKTRGIFESLPTAAAANIDCLLQFLHVRVDDEDQPLLSRLGRPDRHEDGWFRLHWLQMSLDEMDRLKSEGWCRAWHGCKLESLNSIIQNGQLLESRDEGFGERLLTGMPGVYAHRDGLSQKAENYLRFAPLCGDGVFWAAKWELLVNRAEAVPKRVKTDQWVHPSKSVRLVALWLCGRTAAEMNDGDAVARRWDPKMEADPLAFGLRARVGPQAASPPPAITNGDGAADRCPRKAGAPLLLQDRHARALLKFKLRTSMAVRKGAAQVLRVGDLAGGLPGQKVDGSIAVPSPGWAA
ncbi:unnamed protein product [Prorocentrum cordatum]|uniref:Uncharacterized protein n=1 Tax=Prorocentrum cordatum TaxID=2364126 RepID=A0ABN9SXZ3_9DINO|nr:unnamed protein product [Polarella glacialis]